MERSAVARQAEIPPTDERHYITGVHALNVSPPEGTTGDWHDVFHWRDGLDRPAEVWVAGHEPDSDTNQIYGGMGVYEGRSRIVAMGLDVSPSIHEIWIANHFRAILDMVHRSLRRYGAVYNLNGATEDWLDTAEQKNFVLAQAARMADSLTPGQRAALLAWIDYERRDDGSRGGL
jgi:hypothetical protein